MKFDKAQKTRIFVKTDGRCHICRKSLVLKNYAILNARGAWEVEHSIPRAKGGTDHLNNLYPACISCNRKKQDGTTRVARKLHGYRAAPYSKKQKTSNAIWGGVGGMLLGATMRAKVGVRFGLPGMLVFGIVGAIIAADDPE